jgi:hypothetical protein
MSSPAPRTTSPVIVPRFSIRSLPPPSAIEPMIVPVLTMRLSASPTVWIAPASRSLPR